MSSYKAYIQSLNNVPIDDWGFIAYLGFKKKGMDIIFYEEIEEVPLNSKNIIVGCIEDTLTFFNKLGLSTPSPLHIPPSLEKYCNRYVEYMTMESFLSSSISYPKFIKPHSKIKEFISGVIRKDSSKIYFKDVDPTTIIQVSEVVDIISEYRGFVIGGELKSLQHYIGDFKIFPNCQVIEKAISEYKDQPIGYSIDFGITSGGDTVLIECNDGWSLGCYGCDPTIYTNLLTKRWMQLFHF